MHGSALLCCSLVGGGKWGRVPAEWVSQQWVSPPHPSLWLCPSPPLQDPPPSHPTAPPGPPIPSHSPTRSPSPSLHTDHPQIRSVSVLGGALGAPMASSGSRGDSGCHSVPMGGVWLCALPPLGCETLGAVCPIPLRTPPLPHLGPPPPLCSSHWDLGGLSAPPSLRCLCGGGSAMGIWGGGEEMGRVQTGLGRILCFERNPEHLPHPSPRGGSPLCLPIGPPFLPLLLGGSMECNGTPPPPPATLWLQ